ncbi:MULTISPECIES: hypothetical protein [Nocardia]|uniref:DUF4232 domain-containing protein n=1 Tax=Nocardia sputorum TaxID=2984338 RepID=A0ABN6TXD4_9NOCA|nr:hypothetical protein [Nocardia sputorum]BDT97560.1 hypothetical protein IFM12276_05890 [Nocardia sputorum]
MDGRQPARRSALVAALCAGAFTATAPATAGEPAFVNIGVIHTFGDTCYGEGHAGVSSPTGTPGAARFGISFVNQTPTDAPCTFTAFANWRNLDSGATGTVPVLVTDKTASNQPSATVFAALPTGSGRVQVDVTTDYPHVAAPPVEIRIS